MINPPLLVLECLQLLSIVSLLESTLLKSSLCVTHGHLIIIVVNARRSSHIVSLLLLFSHSDTWVPVIVFPFGSTASFGTDALLFLMRECLVRWLTLIKWLFVLNFKLSFKSIYDLVILLIIVNIRSWRDNDISSIRVFFLVGELSLFSQLLVELWVIHLLLLISRASRSRSGLDTLSLRKHGTLKSIPQFLVIETASLSFGFFNFQQGHLFALIGNCRGLIVWGTTSEFKLEPVNEYVVFVLVVHQLNLHEVSNLSDTELVHRLW
jgi:hypothetical protein